MLFKPLETDRKDTKIMLVEFEHIQKNGVEYVLVPEENFREMQEQLDDADDLRLLRAARAENEGKPRLTHEEMMRQLGLAE